jgi:hypothetical protein
LGASLWIACHEASFRVTPMELDEAKAVRFIELPRECGCYR